MLRLFVPLSLRAAARIALPPDAARHVQVRRLQPGLDLVLFNGQGGQWRARIATMGRVSVEVDVLEHDAGLPPPHVQATLAVGMPANDRMDWLVEKAGEIGAHALVPLVCERSVLRLDGERARRRRAHWQAVALAAAEQSGATTVTSIAEVQPLDAWLRALPGLPTDVDRYLLTPRSDAAALPSRSAGACTVLSGPEGGLSPAEEALATSHGFKAASLGTRVLRAETAPLVALVRCLA